MIVTGFASFQKEDICNIDGPLIPLCVKIKPSSKTVLFILTEAFSGYTPNEMLNFNTQSVQRIPLGAQLSMQRQIGMMSVFKKMQYIGKGYTASA